MKPSGRLVGLLFAAIGVLACKASDGTKIGAPCATSSECSGGNGCVYKIADGCSAKLTCQKNPTGPRCDFIRPYCGCDGSDVAVYCSDGDYVSAPVGGPKQSAVCPTGFKDAGSLCTDTSQCGVGQVCVFAIADGCAAAGACGPQKYTPDCGRSEVFCGCDGFPVDYGCDTPSGFALAPVLRAKDGGTCPPPPVDAGPG